MKSSEPKRGDVADAAGEDTDHYLDRYMLPMSATISQNEVASWRDCLQRAWEIFNHREPRLGG